MRLKAVLVSILIFSSVHALAGEKKQPVIPKVDAVKDDVTIVQADAFLTDIKWLLNVTQFHPEREIFRTNGAESTQQFFAGEFYDKFREKEDSFANAFEKSRAEEKLKADLAMVVEESKKVARLPVPIIELDAAFKIDDKDYTDGCYRPWVYPTKILYRSSTMYTTTMPANYLGVDIPAKSVSVEYVNNQALICVPSVEAEKLFMERQSISMVQSNGSREIKGYAGKAYYAVREVCNNLTVNFSKGRRTGVKLQLVAFKVFDASGALIYEFPKSVAKK